jgi:hypothetical protein
MPFLELLRIGLLRVSPVFPALLLAACTQCSHGAGRPAGAQQQGPGWGSPVELGELRLAAAADTQPRLLLDAGRIARLRESRAKQTPAWRRVQQRCEEQAKLQTRSGYQGFDWADAIATLSLCWHATSDARYGRAAVVYVTALQDDRFAPGDGKGGARVVHHDSGYGIRTFGAYSALGYDWLRGAPGMTVELKQRIVDRLDAWLGWYEKNGYLRDHPLANYFWGYFTALSLAGLAVGEDSPQARGWRDKSKTLLSSKILPAFERHLRGGDWPEGWQYGEYVAVQAVLVAKAYETAAGMELAKHLPWLGDLVHHHLHALAPDRRAVYGGGTWGERPSRPSALALSAAAVALDGLDDERAAQARWLVANALPELTREHAWVALLADRPGARTRDPRAGAVLSRLHPGTGLSLMRSDWNEGATWVSFQAGPRLTPDHQHKDQGHFELWRGSDWLIVDGGDAEGGATINHNTLLVDDGGRLMTYSPNQGVWGHEVTTSRYGDDGRAVVVVGEIGDAYAPACVRNGCRQRTVHSITRTLAYVRPSLVVIEDRIVLEDEAAATTWAAHFTVNPVIAGKSASAQVGKSRVDLSVVAPSDAELSAVREPNRGGEGPHRKSSPWRPMWRLEVDAKRGEPRRRFLHWITTDAADAPRPAAPRELAGRGLRGALGASPERKLAVLFADGPRGGEVTFGPAPDSVLVAGLDPGQRYAATLQRRGGCTLEVTPAPVGEVATGGGFIRLELSGCERKR